MNPPYSRLAFALMDERMRKFIAWNNTAPVSLCEECVDCDGRIIRRADYGKDTQYGWEIDHIIPKGIGGSDTAYNVRARHRHGNRSAGGVLGAALQNNRLLSGANVPAQGALAAQSGLGSNALLKGALAERLAMMRGDA